MRKQIKQLEIFQKAFKSNCNTTPTFLTEEEYKLRYALSLEELNEYKDACEDSDMVEILDAIVDRIFLAFGDAVAHGLQDKLPKAFQEVFVSNMSKLDSDGEPIINGKNGVLDNTRPIGKLLKSELYFEPNLQQFLDEA
jgi:predicted HAD superfamily Cof-like phosphohydrolase